MTVRQTSVCEVRRRTAGSVSGHHQTVRNASLWKHVKLMLEILNELSTPTRVRADTD